MPQIKGAKISLSVDADGFLTDIEEWNEDAALALAAREGFVQLSDDQVAVLRALREYYRRYRFFPIIRSICRTVHQPRGCVTDHFADPVTAWKIAGLPNPGEEVLGFGSWEPLGY
jgi:tRNA 2-thiouridine synthesizing protein E